MPTFTQRVFYKKATIVVLVAAVLLALTIGVLPFTTWGANTNSIDIERSSNQHLSRSDALQTGLDITGDLTLEAWIKPESQPVQGGLTEDYAIIGKWDGSTNNSGYLFLYEARTGPNGLSLFASNDGGVGAVTAGVPVTLPLGSWSHVAVVYTASLGQAEFFVNGISIGTASGFPNSLFNNAADFAIGGYNVSLPSTSSFDGLIDDARVWNTARTGVQISANYNMELAGNESGLQGYWKLNNNYLDSTANGNTLTPINSPVFSTDTPFGGFVEVLKAQKTVNESLTASTTLQDDDELALSLANNKSYAIEGVIFTTSTSAIPDIKIAFDAPSGSVITIGYMHSVDDGVLLTSGTASGRIVVQPANTPRPIFIKGTITTGSTAGLFRFKWAQFGSNANPTTVMKGSYLKAEEF